MPKRSSTKLKRKPDENEAAFSVVERVIEETEGRPKRKNPAAVALGRRGGLKGGRARADKLSKHQLSDIARRAALARWATKLPES